MKRHLRNIVWELGVFFRRNWFLVILLDLSAAAYALDRTELMTWMSLTYISSFTFYVLTIYTPERKNQRNMSKVITPYLREVITATEQIFYTALAGVDYRCNHENPTDDDFFEIFRNIKTYDTSARLEYLGFPNWFEYLQYQRQRVEKNIDRILAFEHFLETDFILLLEKIHHSSFYESLTTAQRQPGKHEDYSFLADPYYQCFRQMGELKDYLKKLSLNF
jgi:hypothetical protein